MARSDSLRRRWNSRHILLIALAVATLGIWLWSQQSRQGQLSLLRNPDADADERAESMRAWVRRGADGVPELIAALADDDPRVRRDAAVVLFRIGTAAQSAIPAFQECLSDPDDQVRVNAASALRAVQGNTPETAAMIATLLDDADESVRFSATMILREMGPAAVPSMLERLEASRPQARLTAIEVLRPLMNGLATEASSAADAEASPLSPETTDKIVGVLRQSASDDDPQLRRSARTLLASVGRATITELAGWINDDDHEVADGALDRLGRMGSAAEPAVPELIVSLERRADAVSTNSGYSYGAKAGPRRLLDRAVGILASLKEAAKPAVPVLLDLLQRPGAHPPVDALPVLVDAGVDRETLVPLLSKYIQHSDPQVAQAAARQLIRIDQAAVRVQAARLCGRLQSSKRHAVLQTLLTLLEMGPQADAAVADVLPLLRHEDPDIQMEAAQVLTAIGPGAAAAVPHIAARLQQRDDNPTMIKALVEVAGAIGPQASSVASLLMEIIIAEAAGELPQAPQASGGLRGAALYAAARIGVRTPEYQEAVRTALDDASPGVSVAAMRALAEMNSADRAHKPVMVRHLRSADPRQRLFAAAMIVEIVGPDAELAAPLAACLRDDSPPGVRIAAARSLGRLGPEAAAALPDLKAALTARDNVVALTASCLIEVDRCSLERTLGEDQAVRSVAEVIARTIPRIEAIE